MKGNQLHVYIGLRISSGQTPPMKHMNKQEGFADNVWVTLIFLKLTKYLRNYSFLIAIRMAIQK